jgi:hypothetical protein
LIWLGFRESLPARVVSQMGITPVSLTLTNAPAFPIPNRVPQAETPMEEA